MKTERTSNQGKYQLKNYFAYNFSLKKQTNFWKLSFLLVFLFLNLNIKNFFQIQEETQKETIKGKMR